MISPLKTTPRRGRCANVNLRSSPQHRRQRLRPSLQSTPHPWSALRTLKNVSQRSVPRGFTLFEVFIALTLSLLLMGAVYASIDLYWRYATAGRDRVERAQISRALIRRMRNDLQSIVFRLPEPEVETTDSAAAEEDTLSALGEAAGEAGSSGETIGASTTVSEVEDLASSSASTSPGLVGFSDQLTIHVTRPSRQLSYAPLFSGIGPASDQQTISYFLAQSGGSGLSGVVANIAMSRDGRTASDGNFGLAVLAGDRLAIEYADANADTEQMGSQAEILAPEISLLQFRYFDGTGWVDSWDSSALGQLPKAVEITIGFREPAARQTAANRQLTTMGVASAPIAVLRSVVAIPITPVSATSSEAAATVTEEEPASSSESSGSNSGGGGTRGRAFGEGTGFGNGGGPGGGGPGGGGPGGGQGGPGGGNGGVGPGGNGGGGQGGNGPGGGAPLPPGGGTTPPPTENEP